MIQGTPLLSIAINVFANTSCPVSIQSYSIVHELLLKLQEYRYNWSIKNTSLNQNDMNYVWSNYKTDGMVKQKIEKQMYSGSIRDDTFTFSCTENIEIVHRQFVLAYRSLVESTSKNSKILPNKSPSLSDLKCWGKIEIVGLNSPSIFVLTVNRPRGDQFRLSVYTERSDSENLKIYNSIDDILKNWFVKRKLISTYEWSEWNRSQNIGSVRHQMN